MQLTSWIWLHAFISFFPRPTKIIAIFDPTAFLDMHYEIGKTDCCELQLHSLSDVGKNNEMKKG